MMIFFLAEPLPSLVNPRARQFTNQGYQLSPNGYHFQGSQTHPLQGYPHVQQQDQKLQKPHQWDNFHPQRYLHQNQWNPTQHQTLLHQQEKPTHSTGVMITSLCL